jgi:hypothetical protein
MMVVATSEFFRWSSICAASAAASKEDRLLEHDEKGKVEE